MDEGEGTISSGKGFTKVFAKMAVIDNLFYTGESIEFRNRFEALFQQHLQTLVLEKVRTAGRDKITREDVQSCLAIPLR